jgi:hypothetical protein
MSVFGMATPVNVGCQILVDIKKIPSSVQKNRMIVVLVTINMAVLPVDGATSADVADHQDHVKVLGCHRGVLCFIESMLSPPTSIAP